LNVGSGTAVIGTFTGINWGSGAKFLHVMMNTGSGNVDLGTQQMMSVPYALYADDVNVRVSNSGDSLFIGDQFSIVPGVSAANPISMSNYGSVLLPGNTTCQSEFISVTSCGGQDSLLYYDRYYNLVEIGGQCWFAENLATDKYKNGDAIPNGLNSSEWQSTISGAYALYADNPANDIIYGKLYNWNAVIDDRGVCPTGWHVPTQCDWNYLSFSLGGDNISGGRLKSPYLWINNQGSFDSNFLQLPNGFKNYFGANNFLGSASYTWSATSINTTNASGVYISANSTSFSNDVNDKKNGQAIRCLKD
jgi:uncharacterized protein (TIGR02145 family)